MGERKNSFQIFKGITHKKVLLYNIELQKATVKLRKDFLMIHTKQRQP